MNAAVGSRSPSSLGGTCFVFGTTRSLHAMLCGGDLDVFCGSGNLLFFLILGGSTSLRLPYGSSALITLILI